MEINSYFLEIEKGVKKAYEIAGRARAKGLDPENKVETPIATSLAEKTIGLISIIYPQLDDKKIVNRILELEELYGQLDATVSFKIAEEIAREKFCKFKDLLQAIDAGIRVGFAYFTLGVVSSPLEGYTGIKLEKTRDGKDYIKAYFSGPIRSAGTTASCIALMLIDYLRETFGFARYDPTEEEVKRYVTENYDYHERVTNLQYLPTEGEIIDLAKNLPIQIAGEPTEQREVSNYKDLKRIETNLIRGGMCLIFSEGLAQKAQKGWRLLNGVKENGLKCTGWDFLGDYLEKHKKKAVSKGDQKPTYIKDLVAGRPVLSHPSRSGGFRFRYGRSRTGGFSATSIHPATMAISNSFLSSGTQLKVEKPTKGCAISVCDSIDGPIVKLKNGSVRKISDPKEAFDIYKDVDEIIYLGDILFPLGDVINRNYNLIRPGYVEEWWALQLEKLSRKKLSDLDIDMFNVGFDSASELSRKYGVPLHPNSIYYWREISREDFFAFLDWFVRGEVKDGRLVLPYRREDKERFVRGKRALELIGCEHEVFIENVVFDKENTKALLFNLGLEIGEGKIEEGFDLKIKKIPEKEVLEIINEFCSVEIKDKSGEFIGARMGRPEKAKLRKLVGSPHVLFPVGEEGGRLRSFQAALEKGYVTSNFPDFYCSNCKKNNIYKKCNDCGEFCELMKKENYYEEKRINIRDYFEKAKKKVGVGGDEIPIVKGVRGTSNEDHTCENLAKGLLRAKHGLNVNKDGTIRYDMTEMAMTHFKPCEIGTGIEKLKALGYEKDMLGRELERDDQILQLFPQDIILPACPDSPDERADDVFLKISNFIDDELEKFYGLERVYNAKTKDDLIGQLFVCIAPHICTATVGRLIGFSKVQVLLASPYMHGAMRRDCFSYDTNVPIYDGKSWSNVKIGEFVENLNPDKKVDIYGTLAKDVYNYKTLAYNTETKKIDVMPIKWFTKHTPTDILSFELENGRELKVTSRHKFYVVGEGGLKEKRAFELIEGDRLIVPYNYDVHENDVDEISLEENFKDREDVMMSYVKEYVKEKMKNSGMREFCKLFSLEKKELDNYLRRDSFPIKFVDSVLKHCGDDWDDLPYERKIHAKRNFVEFPVKIKVDDELMKIIGFYIAEGFSRKKSTGKGYYQVDFAIYEDELREEVKKAIFNKFGLKPSSVGGQQRLTYSSRLFYEFFVDVLKTGKNAYSKRIPSMFLNLPKEKLAQLISAYYEGDGSVSEGDLRVSCDTVSKGLIYDMEFVLSRFGIYLRKYKPEREPGRTVKEFYIKKGREIPKFKSTKLTIPSNFSKKFYDKINFISERKRNILKNLLERINPTGMKVEHDEDYAYLKIKNIKELFGEKTYCLNVPGHHNIIANGIIAKQCDGDEAATMLLMDSLLNFSKKFLPAHRGGTQDSPLVLNIQIRAGEVDDQILDLVVQKYPLELYELCEDGKHSSGVKVETVKTRLSEGRDPFSNIKFTHDCSNINSGVLNSAYKRLPTMDEKVQNMMDVCKKIRAVDTRDTARLVIERHFIRDIRGNLRKFSMQGFRCVGCNSKYRRPPLAGKCTKCGGRLIFTISEGSIMKYMQPALDLANTYKVSPYLKESLELTEMYIQSIFGKEKEKQEALEKWF